MRNKANLIFKVFEEPHCGPLAFKFEQGPLTFTYNSETEILTFDPQLDDTAGTIISTAAQFYFEDFPDRVLKVQIELETVECYTNNKEAVTCGVLNAWGKLEILPDVQYEVHSGNKDVALPVINHLPDSAISQQILTADLTLADGTQSSLSAEEITSLGVTLEVLNDSD